MNKITLQDIITKKMNTLVYAPDDLICDAHYQMQEAQDTDSRIKAYITAQVAMQVNKKLGAQIPHLEYEAAQIKKELDMNDGQIASYYIERLDK